MIPFRVLSRGWHRFPQQRFSSQYCVDTVEAQEVLLLGHPSLRVKATECGSDDLSKVKASLVATLEDFRHRHGFGRGIAAPQIGIERRFLALNMGSGPRVLSDPEITWRSEQTITLYDDCMSIPWLLCKVERNARISVQFTNEDGALETWNELPEATSELLQHEIDHLDGVLIVDIAVGGGHGIVSRHEYEKDPKRFSDDVSYSQRSRERE